MLDAEISNLPGRWEAKMDCRENRWGKKMQWQETGIKTYMQIAFLTQTFTE